MLSGFSLEVPKQTFFGPGERRQLRALARSFGERVFLVSGSTWFEKSGRVAEFLKLLEGLRVEHHSCPAGEPTTTSIETALEAARRFEPEVVVGVGGGSVLDTAKALSGLYYAHGAVCEDAASKHSVCKDAAYQGTVARCLASAGKASFPQPTLPWIALPTTSGTGAEATKNAVVKLPAAGLKKSIRSAYLLAAAIIVDPELTLDLPRAITGMTGMDALTQLIESYVSRKSRPIPRALVRDAFPTMLRALRTLAAKPTDLQARAGAAYGSLISGLALANSGLGAVHGFAAAVGGLYNVPHGYVCAAFLTPVLEVNRDLIRTDVAELLHAAGKPIRRNAVSLLVDEVSQLLDLYALKPKLRAYGVEQKAVKEIVERSTGSSMAGNPKELSEEEKETIVSSLV